MPTIEQHLTSHNKTSKSSRNIRYIVVHYTSGSRTSAGAAYANCVYFANAYCGASAHYFIDDGSTIWQSVRDRDIAWSVGSRSGYWHPAARNANTLNIEVCTAWDFTGEEIENLRWLVAQKMAEYGIDAAHVIRHRDVTGKHCPAAYVDDDKWAELHAYITDSANVAPKAPHYDSGSYSGGSIVDYLRSIGQDSSYAHRKELAAQYGISGYRGTAAQNLALLKALQEGRSSEITSTPESNPGSDENRVARLQRELNEQFGRGLTVDGIWGRRTRAACVNVRRGARGNLTRLIQECVGVDVDGIFGTRTYNAVKAFQRAHGLSADGVVGKNTWRALVA